MVDTATNTDQCELYVVDATFHTNNDNRITEMGNLYLNVVIKMCVHAFGIREIVRMFECVEWIIEWKLKKQI